MPVMDEFREEREAALKEASLTEKIKYYVYYYKWPVIAILALLLVVGVWVYDVVSSKDSAFYAALVNVYSEENAKEFENAFSEYAGIDTANYTMTFDNNLFIVYDSMDEMSLNTSQKMLAFITAGEVDVIVSDLPFFSGYAYENLFYDLRDILSADQLEACQPYLYYMDRKTLQEIENEGTSFEGVSSIQIPDPSKPDEMTDPVPIGIFISDSNPMNEYYYFDENGAVMGIPCNTKQLDNALKFLDFIMNESN